jgi:hypothetical protein
LCRFVTAGIYSKDAPAKLIHQFNSDFLEGLANCVLGLPVKAPAAKKKHSRAAHLSAL